MPRSGALALSIRAELDIEAGQVGSVEARAAQIGPARVRLAQDRAREIGGPHLGELQIRQREIGAGEIGAGEIGGLKRSAHETHRLISQVHAAIGVLQPGADEAGVPHIRGDASPREIGAIQIRARQLRNDQTGLDEAGAREIGAERPSLVENCSVQVGAGKIGVVETRRTQDRARQVETGKIEPGKPLAGKVRPTRGRRERGLHLGARHLRRRHLRRGHVHARHRVLRLDPAKRRDREPHRERTSHEPHCEISLHATTIGSSAGASNFDHRAKTPPKPRNRRSNLLASAVGVSASPPRDAARGMFAGPGGDIGRRLHHALHQRSLRNELKPPFFTLVRRVERAYRQDQLDHRPPAFKRGAAPRNSGIFHRRPQCSDVAASRLPDPGWTLV